MRSARSGIGQRPTALAELGFEGRHHLGKPLDAARPAVEAYRLASPCSATSVLPQHEHRTQKSLCHRRFSRVQALISISVRVCLGVSAWI
jgi:hypothetical protein